jgi:hypothetical protein
MATDADDEDSDGDGQVRLEWNSSFDTKLLEVIKRCDALDAELCTSITPDRQAAIGKELSSLLQIKSQGEELIALLKECEGLKIVVNDESEDSATRAEFRAELAQLEQRVEAIQQDLIMLLLPRDEDDDLGAILEVPSPRITSRHKSSQDGTRAARVTRRPRPCSDIAWNHRLQRRPRCRSVAPHCLHAPSHGGTCPPPTPPSSHC